MRPCSIIERARTTGWSHRSARSPLGASHAADAAALPCEMGTVRQRAPSIRWSATRSPRGSSTAMATRTPISAALARAASSIRRDSSSVSGSFAAFSLPSPFLWRPLYVYHGSRPRPLTGGCAGSPRRSGRALGVVFRLRHRGVDRPPVASHHQMDAALLEGAVVGLLPVHVCPGEPGAGRERSERQAQRDSRIGGLGDGEGRRRRRRGGSRRPGCRGGWPSLRRRRTTRRPRGRIRARAEAPGAQPASRSMRSVRSLRFRTNPNAMGGAGGSSGRRLHPRHTPGSRSRHATRTSRAQAVRAVSPHSSSQPVTDSAAPSLPFHPRSRLAWRRLARPRDSRTAGAWRIFRRGRARVPPLP